MGQYDIYVHYYHRYKNDMNAYSTKIDEHSLLKYVIAFDNNKKRNSQVKKQNPRSVYFENILGNESINYVKMKHLGVYIFELPFEIAYFFSKEDKMYHPDYNLVTKEWVTGEPIVKSTIWKGIFRNAFYEIYGSDNHELEETLFGIANNKDAYIGSIFFYTSIITGETKEHIQTELKANKRANPIKFETVNGKGVLKFILSEFLLRNNITVEDVRNTINIILNKIEELGVGAKRKINWGRIKFNKDNMKINGENYVTTDYR